MCNESRTRNGGVERPGISTCRRALSWSPCAGLSDQIEREAPTTFAPSASFLTTFAPSSGHFRPIHWPLSPHPLATFAPN